MRDRVGARGGPGCVDSGRASSIGGLRVTNEFAGGRTTRRQSEVPDSRVSKALVLLASIAGCIAFWLSPEPRCQTFGYAISSGAFVSAVFYFLVVWLPAKQRRSRIHRGLKGHYAQFRRSCISTFLIACDSQDYDPVDMLFDQAEFRRYFQADVSPGQSRWDAVWNGVAESPYLLRELQFELEILRDEVLFALNNIDVHDDSIYELMKRLSHTAKRMNQIENEYDDRKSIAQFFWEIFTGWSFIDGYRDVDLLLSALERL